VLFVTDEKGYISFEEFLEESDFEYNNNHYLHKINLKLKIVGKDFWLERSEYDGLEWWEFKTLPIKPEKHGVSIHDEL
jgi:hypothetical protein